MEALAVFEIFGRAACPVDFCHRLGGRELTTCRQHAKQRSEAQAQKSKPGAPLSGSANLTRLKWAHRPALAG